MSIIALSAPGCGSDPAGGGGSSSGSDQGGGGSGGGEDGCDQVAAKDVTDVSGRWAYRGIGSQLTQALGGTPFHTRIVSVMLFEQQQSGDDVTLTGEYCDHFTEDPDAQVRAIVPDKYREALQPVSRTGTFAEDGGTRRYRLDPLYEVQGATLMAPTSDALPTDPTDPRVVDGDNDTHPGMTLRLQGLVDGEVYVVDRRRTELDGAAVTKDRIEGKLAFKSEQNILASDPESLKALTNGAKVSVDPEACNSTFVLVRVAGDVDCAAIKAQENTLFE